MLFLSLSKPYYGFFKYFSCLWFCVQIERELQLSFLYFILNFYKSECFFSSIAGDWELKSIQHSWYFVCFLFEYIFFTDVIDFEFKHLLILEYKVV